MGAPHGNKNASGPHKRGKAWRDIYEKTKTLRQPVRQKSYTYKTKGTSTLKRPRRTSLSTQHKVLAKYTRKMEKQYGRGY